MLPGLGQSESWGELGSGDTEDGSGDCDDEDGCQGSGTGTVRSCELEQANHSPTYSPPPQSWANTSQYLSHPSTLGPIRLITPRLWITDYGSPALILQSHRLRVL